MNLSTNNLGEQDGIAVGQALQHNSTLTELHLRNNNIGEQGGTVIGRALRENTALTYLSLSYNNLGEQAGIALGQALQHNSTLMTLVLCTNNLGRKGGIAIGEGLQLNNSLTWLTLRNNNIREEGGKAIGQALQKNVTLINLFLDNNNLGEQGGLAIGQALHYNGTLTELYLDNNNLGKQGGISIGQALKINTALTKLCLKNNNLGEEGGVVIGEGLQCNTTLTQLDLDNNMLGEKSGMAIGQALQDNTNLIKLSLSNNCLGEKGGIAIGQALQRNSTLTTLSLDHNNLGEGGGIAIGEGLQCNDTLTELHIDILRNRTFTARLFAGTSPTLELNYGAFPELDAARRANTLLLHSGPTPRTQITMYVCGHDGAGKTTLINSFLESSAVIPAGIEGRTRGMRSYTVALGQPKRPFVIWDFGGQHEYYISHQFFLYPDAAVFLLLLNLTKPPSARQASAMKWLRMIKARVQGIDQELLPEILIMGTFKDQLPLQEATEAETWGNAFCQQVSDMFESQLKIQKIFPVINASKRDTLDAVYAFLFQSYDKIMALNLQVPKIAEQVVHHLDLLSPTCYFMSYEDLVHQLSQMLRDAYYRQEEEEASSNNDTEEVKETMKLSGALVPMQLWPTIIRHLSDIGKVLYLPEANNTIFLNVQWLCDDLLGTLLAPAHFPKTARSNPTTGTVTRGTLKSLLPKHDDDLVIATAQKFDLCYQQSEDVFVFPALLQDSQILREQRWKPSKHFTCHLGLQLTCATEMDEFPYAFFPNVQVSIRNKLQQLDLELWFCGISYMGRGKNAQCLLRQLHEGRVLSIWIRFPPDARSAACQLLFDTMTIIHNTHYRLCCNVELSFACLSVAAMENYVNDPLPTCPFEKVLQAAVGGTFEMPTGSTSPEPASALLGICPNRATLNENEKHVMQTYLGQATPTLEHICNLLEALPLLVQDEVRPSNSKITPPAIAATISRPGATILQHKAVNSCERFRHCQDFVNNVLKISPNRLDARYNKCYCHNCIAFADADGPLGWARFSLIAHPSIVEDHKVFTKWIPAFHGCSHDKATTILSNDGQLLSPGTVPMTGDLIKVVDGHIGSKEDPGNYPDFCKQIFTSPSIVYVEDECYSPVTKHAWDGYKYKVAFQLRQKVDKTFAKGKQTLKAGSALIDDKFANDELEYSSRALHAQMLVGLLVFAVPDTPLVEQVENFVETARNFANTVFSGQEAWQRPTCQQYLKAGNEYKVQVQQMADQDCQRYLLNKLRYVLEDLLSLMDVHKV
eukprot:m.238626 g.238626  ORF g.238626 m.238626 type:complete len:1263 (-) comp26567_c2_seq3:111-3899(-)